MLKRGIKLNFAIKFSIIFKPVNIYCKGSVPIIFFAESPVVQCFTSKINIWMRIDIILNCDKRINSFLNGINMSILKNNIICNTTERNLFSVYSGITLITFEISPCVNIDNLFSR